MPPDGSLIYCDTNVYSRPFDDQAQVSIQEESNAFLEIMSRVKGGELRLLCSDILEFEIIKILREEKRSRVKSYLALCSEHVGNTKDVLDLGRQVQENCHVRARDALHVASAIIGKARYFLSCDNKVTQMKQARCYRRLAKGHQADYFSAMNPTQFSDKLQKGEIE